jgi:hypothetical protein
VISAPPNFTTANAALNKRPVIVINIAKYWRAFTTFDPGLSALGGTGFGGGNGAGRIGAVVQTGVVTVPGNAGPWKYNDPSFSFQLTGSIGPPVQIPVTPGQYVRITYRSGVVNRTTGPPTLTTPPVPYGPYGMGPGTTDTGVYTWPSDRCSNGGFPNGSNVSLLTTFTDASGNAAGPVQLAYFQSFVMGPAPSTAVNLNLGVNTYEDWSPLSGGWNIAYEVSNSGIAGDGSPGSIGT